MPERFARRLTVVVNLPVSINCNMHLLADGPYDRMAMRRFVRQLQEEIDLGAFDEQASVPTGACTDRPEQTLTSAADHSSAVGESEGG